MDFVAVVDQVIALLRQRGRLTYRTLQRQFQLDDAALDDLKDELLYGQRLAADEDGRVLVWTGERGLPHPQRHPHGRRSPTPAYLAEKIHLQKHARRRAQAGHGLVCGPQGLYGVAGRPRP